MKVTVYKLKNDIDYNKLAELGYEWVPRTSYIFVKSKRMDENSDLVQHKLKGLYLNPNWIEKFYNPNKETIVEKIGLRYNKNGTIRKNSKFKNALLYWNIIIDTQDDSWIGVTSNDNMDTSTYYNKLIIDKFFGEEIQELKDADILEEIEVEE